MDLEKGSVLFGKYKIIKKVGEGSFAKVYLSVHVKLNSYRAIKCILKKDMHYEQLMREVNILKNVRNEHIPIIYDIEECGEGSYIIEEFCEGTSLKEYVSTGKLKGISEVINYSSQICDVLDYLHSHEQRILYLDLKPDNLMISQDKIKLVDFGAAVSRETIEGDNERLYYGSVTYSSPEQKKGKYIDNRSDIYSLGKVILFLLDKAPRLREEDNMAFGLRKIAKRCVSNNPLFRYNTVEGIKKDLVACSKRSPRLQSAYKKLACEDYKAMKVCVCESDYGIGAFPLSLMIAKYLSENMRTTYVDLSKEGYLKQMINAMGIIKEKDGNCIFDGYVLEESYVWKDESTSRVINYGKGLTDKKEGIWEWDIVICLCSMKRWNTENAKELIMYLNICENLRIVADCEESKKKLYEVFGKNKKIYVLPDIREYDAGGELDSIAKRFVEELLLE